MLQSNARWKINKPDEQLVKQLAEQLGVSMIAARFLIQRNFTKAEEANAFLHIDKNKLHDPFEMKDMEKGIDRMKRAIDNNEKILIFGDYDADGVTSTSLMYLTLKQLGAQVGFYVPNRFTEGYGPNENAFRHAHEEGITLIITVDTGISAVHEANVAKDLGMDLIITDHHEPPPEIPQGYAVINPKREDCPYPNKNLAGVGVAFKFAEALLGELPEQFLDLVALGTVADLVPLVDENRYFVTKGVRNLSRNQRPGLKALMAQCGIEPEEMSEEQVGFMIGPRLNAAGRLDSADPAIHLLTSEDPYEAEEIALMIDDLNKERQKIVSDMTKEAEKQVEESGIPPVIIVGQEGWNAGVIGIVASRLVEKYYRPTIVLSLDSEKGLAKGSARSIEGFDMFQSLSQCREWLPHFGGHPMAAGLTMEIEHVEPLHEKLIQIAEETLTEEDWIRSLHVDLPVQLHEVTIEAINDLKTMAPFGVGNPAPKILIEEVEIDTCKKIGAKQDHLKITFKKENQQLDGIGFRMGDKHDALSPLAKASVVGQLSINEWNGHSKPQIILEDMKVDGWQLFDLRGDHQSIKTISHLPADEVTFVVFREKSMEAVHIDNNWDVYKVYSDETILNKSRKYIVLYDLPESIRDLENVLESMQEPHRIYACFQHDESSFFETLPTREQFKWLYAFLRKRGSFDMKKHGADLAKHKNWSEKSIHFMCKVFFDLEFVKINNGLITVEEHPQKKDLVNSPTYQRRIEQSELENELLYSSYRSLKKQLEDAMNDKALSFA
ncbi:single-stranded-DNA-specific exonuclease RecJ [Bacillus shivajii]|uniref:single-stranded-DNA-specific exonuclease RecJ n=1 Tax=Bacillus shivajii TaxID=1983719 RepID=UPI001CF98FA9|nr:single-stranded-DNA-specific exonuclease RecJ [Bacillus shivajii]UCZ54363.1 single-stranded-DNA-specific exonuclease RecJ [Bacillus shivajii]